MTAPDVSYVDLHRVSGSPLRVEHIRGRAWRVNDGGRLTNLDEGESLEVGDTVAVSAEGELQAEGLTLPGGRRGKTHSLVATSAFRSSPSRADVPKLLRQLAQIEQEIAGQGSADPLAAAQSPPRTPHEQAQASEFARSNLSIPAARLLSEALARELRVLVLFVSDETAFVAMEDVTVWRLRRVMEALERPVHTHLVTSTDMSALLEKVYGAGLPAPA
ncbi:MAG: hypothetical protein ACFB9M_06285 [Myxococcota bacterium]